MKALQVNKDILLVNGDMRLLRSHVGNRSVDCLLTDPPYKINYQSNHRKEAFDKIEEDEIGEIDPDWFWICDTVKDTGSFYCFHRWDVQDQFKKNIDLYENIKIRNQLIWLKNNDTGGDLKRAYGAKHECIWFATGDKFEWHWKRPTSVLFSPKVSGVDMVHPTQKPVQLLKEIISNSLPMDAGMTVFDPFMGSGSTGIAAVERGQKFIGFELSKEYFDIALARITKRADEVSRQGKLF